MLVGIQPLTIKRYRRAIRHFFSFLSLHGFTLPNSLVDLDEKAAEYINHLYLDDYPLHDASCFVAGIKRLFPRCRRHLETTTAWYHNWAKSVKRDRATPASSELVIGMSVAALLEGEPRLALALLLGFLGLLRTGEILKLKAKHLCIENEMLLVVTLIDTKAGQRKGQDEQVMITDPDVISLARRVTAQVHAEALVLPWSWGRLARAVSRLSAKFGIEDEQLTPYCLRRGGATWYFGLTGSYDLTQEHGRWAQIRNARRYIDQARAELARVAIPAWGQSRLVRSRAVFREAIRSAL